MRHTALTSVCVSVVLAVLSATHATAAELGPGVGTKFPHELAAPDQAGKPQTLKSLMGEKGVAPRGEAGWNAAEAGWNTPRINLCD